MGSRGHEEKDSNGQRLLLKNSSYLQLHTAFLFTDFSTLSISASILLIIIIITVVVIVIEHLGFICKTTSTASSAFVNRITDQQGESRRQFGAVQTSVASDSGLRCVCTRAHGVRLI
uniref:Uncharacterized protein n=1 Tax=Trichogramma kaykai TaxID=54128 RepID=A0ABD2X2B9_9HYME